MALGRQKRDPQANLWLATQDLVTPEGHPFYERLNTILEQAGFDAFVERRCQKFYKAGGRPSIPPGVYFRMLTIGYFEGLDSERGIAWRCADSLGLRQFLGYRLTQGTPEHSSLSVIRTRLDLRTHQQVFRWVLIVLARAGLVKGKIVGVDATTLVANAAMKSIVRRDTGQSYEDFLRDLAHNAGIENPTKSDLAKLDRKRKNKASNDDWTNPNDPDAKIAKLKDGRTHLAHKDEPAVDLDTGAVLSVTLQGADQGDTSTLPVTWEDTRQNLSATAKDEQAAPKLSDQPCRELVADKGYHSNAMLVNLEAQGVRSYIAEPDRGKRDWEDRADAQKQVYANHRRIRGDRGKGLLRRRGELLERPFAHSLETGRMRRVYLRGHENILKRLVVHVAGMNLGLLMRTLFGVGTPRGLQGRGRAFGGLETAFWRVVATIWTIRADASAIGAAADNFGEPGGGNVKLAAA